MTDLGGVEAEFYFKSSSDDYTSKEPSLEIVAVPLDVDGEALFINGGMIRIQVDRSKVNDNDLETAVEGPCTGYFTVYPGYISKKMEPPKGAVRTYFVEWIALYRDENYYFISLRYSRYELGAEPDFFWGRFG